MNGNPTATDGSSVVRSILVATGVVALFAMGQWVAAAVLSVSYGSVDVLARLRRSIMRLPRSEPASQAAFSASDKTRSDVLTNRGSSKQAHDHQLVVEQRPRSERGRDGAQGNDSKGDKKDSSGGIMGKFKSFMDKHPRLKAFVTKIGKDNIGMLSGFLSWSLLTSMVPLIVGLVAITGLVLRDPATQRSVVEHLAAATQGFSAKDIESIVHGSVQHAGIFGLIGFIGVLWGGSNIGGSISTIFQAIFEVNGRSFIKEKLIDVGMIFVFAALMIVIILGASASALLSGLIAHVPFPGVAQAVGIVVDLIAAFLLFSAVYLVFPNIDPPFRFHNVWKGALLASILFTILSQVWGIYANFQHFGKYGQILGVLLVLTAWIYFFSMILVVGAEVVAFESIEEAKSEARSVGPEPQESVPQHDVLRKDPAMG